MISCIYRIHPYWRGFDGDAEKPTMEMAQRAARSMGRSVIGVTRVSDGHDHGGFYVDIRVTYSSTRSPSYEEIRR